MANNVCMKKKKNMFLLHLKPALLLSSDPGRVMSPLRHPINALEIFCCQGIKSSTKNVVSAPCEMQRWLHTQGSLFVVFIMKQRPLDLKFIAYRLTVRFSPPLFSLKCSHCSIQCDCTQKNLVLPDSASDDITSKDDPRKDDWTKM